MAALFIGVFLFLTSVVFPVQAEVPRVRDLRVTDAFGQVTLKTVDHPKQAAVVDEETPLAQEDILETGPKSGAELTMDGKSVFSLQPSSRLRVKYLYQKNTILELLRGTMLTKLKPAPHSDPGLFIKMPTALVAVQVAELAVQSGAGVSYVGVFDEGHTAVRGAWGHEAIVLAPNQETKIPLSNVPQSPHKLNYFKALKNQMPRLRARITFWRVHWRPLSEAKKQKIRARLYDPHRSKSTGFLQSSVRSRGRP